MQRLTELPDWPVYGVPYEVEDPYGTYVEVIAPGAADGAVVARGDYPGMVVSEEEWDADSTHRTILKIRRLTPRSLARFE